MIVSLVALALGVSWAIVGGWWALRHRADGVVLALVNVAMWAGWAVARAGEGPTFGVVLDVTLATWWAAIAFALWEVEA